MELNEFKSRLKDGRLCGCYIFAGEEDYLKRYYLGQLREKTVSDPTLAAFNHAVYDGAEVNFAVITDDITAPPMMSDTKLIEWKYPSFEKMKESDLAAFERVLKLLEDYSYVTLAFLVADGELDIGTQKRPGKFVKRFGDRVNILSFDKSTDAQLLSWLKKHFDAEGIAVSADTLRDMLFRCGHNMTVLNEEVGKLCMYAKANGRSEIDSSDVTLITSSTPECDTFALSNALLDRNKRAALFALEEMKSRRLDPLLITGMMARTYSDLVTVCMMLGDGMGISDIQAATKMNQYKLKHYVGAARKFSSGTAGRILEELTRVDADAKYGGISGYTAIELFISKCV